MNISKLKSLVLDQTRLSAHPNTAVYRTYKRELIDEELLYECLEINKWSALHTANILTDLGIRCGAGYIISRSKEYASICPISYSSSAHKSMGQREKTNLERYGHKNVLGKGTSKYHKRNATVKEKFGVSNVFEHPEIVAKLKQTNLKKYGTEYPWHSCGKVNNFSKPHQIVSEWLLSKNISHTNESHSAIFAKFNSDLNRQYNPYPDILIDKEKIVIEVYGDYWHKNPSEYKADDKLPNWSYIAMNNPGATVKDVWEFDLIRLAHIESFGFRCVVLWESEILDNSYEDKLNELFG